MEDKAIHLEQLGLLQDRSNVSSIISCKGTMLGERYFLMSSCKQCRYIWSTTRSKKCQTKMGLSQSRLEFCSVQSYKRDISGQEFPLLFNYGKEKLSDKDFIKEARIMGKILQTNLICMVIYGEKDCFPMAHLTFYLTEYWKSSREKSLFPSILPKCYGKAWNCRSGSRISLILSLCKLICLPAEEQSQGT